MSSKTFVDVIDVLKLFEVQKYATAFGQVQSQYMVQSQAPL